MKKEPNKETENRENDAHAEKKATTDQIPYNNDIDDTDKYLAMEQQGVRYTKENDPTANSDQTDFGSESRKKEWNDMGGNSKNSDAFNQDDYLLDDNLDLDEDQNQSISSDDDDFEETNERY
ncbi:hypothetical protein ACX0HA_14125 [Flavobacterium hauense]